MLIKRTLRTIADKQCGYFSARQAKSAGYDQHNHTYHASRGNWIKIDRGVFRLPGYEDTLASEFVRWTLCATGMSARRRVVVGYESALHYYGLTPQPPQEMHLIVPADRTPGRTDLPGCVFHQQDLDKEACDCRAGFAITTPFRTLQDMQSTLLLQSRWHATVQLARTRGLLEPAAAARLLGEEPRRGAGAEERVPRMPAIPEQPLTAGAVAAESLCGRFRAYPPYRPAAGRLFGQQAAARSFTLVEMLVVIAILGILASLLAPSLVNALHAAKLSMCQNSQKQILAANQMYADDNYGYAATAIPPGNLAWVPALAPYNNGSMQLWDCPSTGTYGKLGAPYSSSAIREYCGVGINSWGFLGRHSVNNTLIQVRIASCKNPGELIYSADSRTGTEVRAASGADPSNNGMVYLRPDQPLSPVYSTAGMTSYYLRHGNAALLNLGFLAGNLRVLDFATFDDWLINRLGSAKNHFM